MSPTCTEMNGSVYIIAEAGVNHNGSLARALELIDVAAQAGANAVKFQTFRSDKLVGATAPKAEYQVQTTGVGESQLDMIRKLELSHTDHFKLKEHAKDRRIEFLSTPFDEESLRLLTTELGMSTVKLSSGDVTNAPLLLEAARIGQWLILSTGMSTLGEIEEALGVLAFGLIARGEHVPSRQNFRESFFSQEGKAALEKTVTLLHCTTEYPAPWREVNLRAMNSLRAAFGLRVGYSDHTTGTHAAVAAVAMGATVIEKHFTLDRTLPGPDHRASLEPGKLKAMVSEIREIEMALGDGRKVPTPSESKNRFVARRGLVAARPITAGQIFSADNLIAKRPSCGASPMDYWKYVGKTAGQDYKVDEAIDE